MQQALPNDVVGERREPAPAGDRAADGAISATALVRLHWDDAFRVAYLVTQDRASAEDIAQETLLRAIKNRRSLDESRPLTPWIRTVALNAARDWLRRQKFVGEPLDREDAESARVSAATMADEVGRLALSADLTAALRAVDPRFRIVIVMRYLADLSTREVAVQLGIEEATVRSRLRRGLLAAREELRRQGGTA